MLLTNINNGRRFLNRLNPKIIGYEGVREVIMQIVKMTITGVTE